MYTAQGKSEKNDLLKKHSPLVKKLAYQMKAKLPPSVEVDDLVQAGMIGLLDACNRFEENQGVQFETYAAQRIRGAMLDELRSSDWMPRSMRENMRKIETAISALQQRLGRPPSESEVAKHLKMSLSEYQAMLADGRGHQLIYYEDFQDEEEGKGSLLERHSTGDAGNPLEILMDTGFRSALLDSIDGLPEREKNLMGMYYEHGMNLKEIGTVLGVSESRVCQLHSQAIARIRAVLRGKAWIGGV